MDDPQKGVHRALAKCTGREGESRVNRGAGKECLVGDPQLIRGDQQYSISTCAVRTARPLTLNLQAPGVLPLVGAPELAILTGAQEVMGSDGDLDAA